MHRRDALGLSLLAAVGVVTAAWWALALWPLASDAPAWLTRTRWVCFGSTAHGLPNSGGWIALIGEPITMTALLLVVWGDAVRGGVRALRDSSGGQLLLFAAVAVVLAGLGAAGMRVARAASVWDAPSVAALTLNATEATRIDRPAPPLTLIDQRGVRFSLADVRGRPVLVTFAFSHCETVCPLVVHDVLAAVTQAPDQAPVVAIVTLDPWRDVLSRLPAIAAAWGLTGDAHVLGGSVAEVTATIEAWGVTINRDAQTGDITHPAIVYLIDRAGRIAFTAPGGAPALAALLARL